MNAMSFGQQDQDDVLRALSGLISGPPSGISDDMDLTDDRGLANDQAEQARVRAIQQNVPYATHFGDDNPPDMDLTRDPDLLREQLDRKLQLSPDRDHVPTPMSHGDFADEKPLPRGDVVDALKAGPPDPNAAAENRGIAPDEARARLDQQMQLLPERVAPERSSVGTPPTPDAKATTPPSDDATDERPARTAAPETDFKLDAGLGRGVSESAPASTGYSPNALRGLTGGRGGGDSGAPEVSPLAVIAAALDRNPGQQLAAVMGVAAQQKQAWQANQQKMAQQDAQNDIKSRLTDAQIRKLDREGHATSDWAADNSAYKWSQYDQRSKEFGAEQSRLELQEKNWRAINDPESPEFKARNEAKEKAGYGTNYAGQQGRTDAKVAGIPDTTNVIDAETRARVAAKDAQEHTDAPTKAADAGDKAANVATSRIEATDTATKMAAGKNPATPDSHVDNIELWGALKPADQTRGRGVAGAREVFNDSFGIMESLRTKNGPQALASGDRASFDAARSGMLASLSDLFQMKTIQDFEYKRLSQMVHDSSIGLDDGQGFFQGKDVALEKLQAVRKTLDREFGVKMGSYGLAPGPAQAAQAAPGGFDVPGNLGVSPLPPKTSGFKAKVGAKPSANPDDWDQFVTGSY